MEDEVEIGRNKNRHQNNYKSSTAFVVLQVLGRNFFKKPGLKT